MPSITDYPGTFMPVSAPRLKRGDVILGTFPCGELIADPDRTSWAGHVLLAFAGEELFPIQKDREVKVFRPDNPNAVGICACGAAPGGEHNHDCTMVTELTAAATEIWPDLESQDETSTGTPHPQQADAVQDAAETGGVAPGQRLAEEPPQQS